MALSRKYLQGMGLTEEQVGAIIESNEETIAGLKAEIDKYKSDAEKLSEIQKELDEVKAAQGDGGEAKIAELQEKYDALDKEYKEFKSGVTAKETKAKKEEAKKALLKEAGVADKFIDLIMKASADDVDGFEFEEDGTTIKDADKKKEAYAKEYADFVSKKETVGAEQNNPPASNGGGSAPSRAAELYKKHTAEMYGTKS